MRIRIIIAQPPILNILIIVIIVMLFIGNIGRMSLILIQIIANNPINNIILQITILTIIAIVTIYKPVFIYINQIIITIIILIKSNRIINRYIHHRQYPIHQP